MSSRSRSAAQLYVDRTDRIPVLEELGDRLLFLRPRRFGKSLWLSTLATYHDLRLADEHQRLFGDLAIGRHASPPPAHRHFVLRWDFSDLDPDPPPRGVNAGIGPRHRRLANEIHRYVLSSLELFLSRYQSHLPVEVELASDAFTSLDRILAAVEQTPYTLYLLIDWSASDSSLCPSETRGSPPTRSSPLSGATATSCSSATSSKRPSSRPSRTATRGGPAAYHLPPSGGTN